MNKQKTGQAKRAVILRKQTLNREDLSYLAILLLLTIIFFGKIIFSSRNVVLSSPICDIRTEFFACRYFGFRNLAQGILPLWNPYIFSGTPFMAGLESALFYPFNFLYLFLPTHLAINYTIILHIFLSGVFFYYFICYFGVERFPSFISSLVYMFAATQVCHIYAGHLTVLSTIIWIPLLFLFLEKYFREDRFLYIILAGIVLALQILAGYIQVTFYTAIALLLYFLFRTLILYREKKRAKLLVRYSLAFIVLVASGLLLSALQLMPTLELVQHSIRHPAPYAFCTSFSFPPENLITLFTPEIFGNNVQFPYWGRCYFWEMWAYIGILPLILVLLAITLKKNKYTIFFTGLTILSIVLALGRYTPLFKFLYSYVPGFNLFRGNSKFIFLTTFSLATLSAFGIQSLLKKNSSQRRDYLRFSLVLLIITIILALGLGLFLLREGGHPSLWGKILEGSASLERELAFPLDFHSPRVVTSVSSLAFKSILKFLAFLIAITLFLFFYIRKNFRIELAKILIFLLVISDLWLFGLKYLVTFPVKDNFWSQEVVDFLNNDPDYYRILTVEELLLNRGIIYKIGDVAGYEANPIRWYVEFINFSQEKPLEEMQLVMLLHRFPPSLNLLNLKYLILPPGRKVEDPRFTLAFSHSEVSIYRNKDFLPRAYVVNRAKIIPDRDSILKEIDRATFSPRDYVILEDDSAPVLTTVPSGKKETLPQIMEYLPNRVTLKATLLEKGYLVLADTYYPGWRVYVDGREQKIYKANYIQRAVYLEPGEHTIEFIYFPRSFRIGLMLSLFTLIILLGGIFWHFKRRVKNRYGLFF